MSETPDPIIEEIERDLERMKALATRERGRLFVLSGPSGVGKDALLDTYAKLSPDGLIRSVSMTTRAPRVGEVSGVDYHFATPEEFERLAGSGELLEWAQVHGNFYGTPRKWVEAELVAGRDVVLKIDVQGGLAVKQRAPEAILVFVAPPSAAELERRLRGRQSEGEADLRRRLENARAEILTISQYNYLIVNEVLERAARELGAIVLAERCRLGR